MISKSYCQSSKNSLASTLHLVSKKDGSWHLCGGYGRINAVITPDKYLMQHIEDVTINLACKLVFFKIDLLKVFHQIPVAESDVPKMAATTPFGLRNDAQTFQRFMDAMQGLDCCLCYMDDILVVSEPNQEHMEHFRLIASDTTVGAVLEQQQNKR